MFKRLPVTQAAKAQRSLVHGVGINDAPYNVYYKNPAGKKVICPFYKTWASMLERCYSKSLHKRRPSYVGCSVAPEWHKFTTFLHWMELQDWEGKVLDKDIIKPGNKVYSPVTCVFVTKAMNNLLTLRGNHKGKYPTGVSKTAINNQEYFIASCSFYGKQKRLGYFSTPQEASDCYQEAKVRYIKDLASKETDSRLKQALLNIVC